MVILFYLGLVNFLRLHNTAWAGRVRIGAWHGHMVQGFMCEEERGSSDRDLGISTAYKTWDDMDPDSYTEYDKHHEES